MMLPEKKQILVVDDEANLRRVLTAQLSRDGYEVHTAADGEAGLAVLREHHIDLVITDLRMPKIDGLELLRQALRDDPQLPVVILTAHGTVDNAVEALKTGAFDYITKPFDQEEVRTIVKKALRTRDLAETEATREEAREGAGARFGIIGESEPSSISTPSSSASPTRRPPCSSPARAAPARSSSPARCTRTRRARAAVHQGQLRRHPQDLMESELFGYERGAFTGAVTSKPGRFELAGRDAVPRRDRRDPGRDAGEAAARAAGERVRARGRHQDHPRRRAPRRRHQPRSRSARSQPARSARTSTTGSTSCPSRLPALRERVSDIPLLGAHFVDKFNARLKKHVSGIEPDAMERLVSYAWPGNIRELENVLERAILFCDTQRVRRHRFPGRSARRRGREPASGRARGSGRRQETAISADGLKEQVKAAMSRLERELIVRALDQTGGNVTHAARLLKISRKGSSSR